MPSTSTTAARSAWLTRHGERTWHAPGLTQSRADQAELTGKGQRQAAEFAARLVGIPARAVYASDLRRARQTPASFADEVLVSDAPPAVVLVPRLSGFICQPGKERI